MNIQNLKQMIELAESKGANDLSKVYVDSDRSICLCVDDKVEVCDNDERGITVYTAGEGFADTPWNDPKENKMKVSDLVIGNFYTDIDKPEEKLVYVGVRDESPFKGEHDFDAVDTDSDWYTGCICDEEEVLNDISPYESGE